MDDSTSQFLQKFSQLPPKIQSLMSSSKIGVTIRDALSLAKQPASQYEAVMDIVQKILMLEIPKEQFQEELKQKCNFSPAAAQIIDKVIQETIIKQVANDLEQYRSLLVQPKVEKRESIALPPLKTTQSQKEEIHPKKIEELISKTRITEEKPKEEPIKPPVAPEPPLPEIQEIKIERPLNKTGELKRVAAPEVTPEDQEKIHQRLLEAIQKKETKPRVLENIKKVLESGIKKQPEVKPQKQPITPPETPSASKVIGGENNEKFKTENKTTPPEKKPYIFDVKLKQEVKPKEDIKPKDIKYQKPVEKPFGEA